MLVFHKPLNQSRRTFHSRGKGQQHVMEGLPVLIRSQNVKYPDMVKVLSAALPCLLWEPEGREKTFVVLV